MRKNALAISLAGALFCVLPTLAIAGTTEQVTDTVTTGVTGVQFSSGFLDALSSLGVEAGPVGPTTIYDGIATFPITGGAIDLNTAGGNIIHSGGLTLHTSKTNVLLESFIIDTTGAAPVLTGLVVVNGTLLGRVPLFNLILPPGFTLPLKPQLPLLTLSNVTVELSSKAAADLNSVFSVSAFHGGFDIGKADVFAFISF